MAVKQDKTAAKNIFAKQYTTLLAGNILSAIFWTAKLKFPIYNNQAERSTIPIVSGWKINCFQFAKGAKSGHYFH